MATRKMAVCELVEDLDVYPRFQLDDQHVRNLAEALEAGAELPPVVIEKKTKKIVDGWHRKRANERAYGPDHRIDVVEKTYRSQAELFLDAVSLNAAHGKRLVSCDYARTVQKARAFGIEDVSVVARALNITPRKMEMVIERRFARGTLADVRATPIKRTIQHMAGQDLTEAQVEANRKLGGQNQSFYANQLITLLENGLLDAEDENLMARLKRLHDLLEQLLVAP